MPAINEEALDVLFREARTHNVWRPEPVSDELLHRVWGLARLGPTGANSNPLRVVFVRSAEAKERLRPALSPGNVDKTMSAPVTAIFAYDLAFYEKMPELFPHNPKMGAHFAENAAAAEVTAKLNGTLGAAYFMLAARSLGLDCGPMGGFDSGKVNAEFFAESTWRANFLCNLGYGDASKLHPRNPRLAFEDACKVL
ncbi:Putative reductase RutE [Minicystis rosea]|nr:Putative reductase RutE [Minicystis rosea]